MIEINSKDQVLRMGDLSSPPRASDGFIITVRYLRAQNTGDTICIGVELSDPMRNLSETRRYLVLTEFLNKLGLSKGVISREKLEELERASSLSAAYGRALSILAYGANSAYALTLKLRQRGFDAEMADATVALLRERGYLREQKDARREAERCLSKGWGQKRIELYLRQRGYQNEDIRCALEELGEIDEVARCAQVAARKSATPPADAKEKQKLIAYLIRQGYSMSVIRTAFDEAWEQ